MPATRERTARWVEHLFAPGFSPSQPDFRRPACLLARSESWVYNGYTTNEARFMVKNNSPPATKESRLSIRIDPRRKAVIARAAKHHGHTTTDFVLQHAHQMASAL